MTTTVIFYDGSSVTLDAYSTVLPCVLENHQLMKDIKKRQWALWDEIDEDGPHAVLLLQNTIDRLEQCLLNIDADCDDTRTPSMNVEKSIKDETYAGYQLGLPDVRSITHSGRERF
jgi:hypothetical protein